MADRYFSEKPIAGASATLTGNEAHHLLHVMRAKPGTKLVLFDGQGGEYDAEVVECGRKTVEVNVGPCQNLQRELDYPVTLAVALPKGDRQRWLVEKSVELGVTRLVPIQTERSVAAKGIAAAKLHRYVVEASKQCGRNRLMEIAEPQKFDTFLEQTDQAHLRLLAHPGGHPMAELLQQTELPASIAIGPEGGFTDTEVALAKARDWQIVGLGSRLLRVETAALSLVAAIASRA